MSNLQRLIQKAIEKDCCIKMRFDPDEDGEQWGIKFYPHKGYESHFFAYHEDLEIASRLLMDELEGFGEW